MRGLSFQMRVFLFFSGLTLLALAAPLRYFYTTVSEDVVAEVEAKAVEELDMAAWVISGQAGEFTDMRQADAWITEFADKAGFRITLIQDGTVIVDSEVPYGKITAMDDHGSRPEVQEAGSGNVGISIRFSKTLRKELIYAARPMEAAGILPECTLRLAVPMSGIKARLEGMGRNLFWTFAVGCVAVLAISFLLSRGLVRSIRHFSKTALAIGGGNYFQRVREYPGKEFAPLAEAINTMAENIRTQVLDLEDRKGQIEAMFNGMAEGVLVLDSKGNIESWNRSLEEMIPNMPRYKGGQLLEATMEPELQRAVNRLLREPAGMERITSHLAMAGGRHIEVALEPFRDKKGVRKMILLFYDITEVKRLEMVRRDFVANVSHELRTPITNIKGYAETMQDGPGASPENMGAFLEVILRNADHMTEMVNELLELSRLEASNGKVELGPVNGGKVLAQVLEDMGPAASARSVRMENNMEDGLPPVLCTRDGVHRIFKNLLDNAVKYSPDGGLVSIFSRREGDFIVFSVRDQGPGVPDSDKERIFERFYRTPDQRKGKVGGYGLGLAICRNIVRASGGKVGVESPVNGGKDTGAEFWFSLEIVDH